MKHLFFGRTQSLHTQFFRYLFVGGAATCTDLGLYWLLTHYHTLQGTAASLIGKFPILEGQHIEILLATFFGYCFGFIVNHTLSLLWVFESKHSRSKEFALAAVITVGGLIWTELLMWGFVHMFGDEWDFFGRFVVVWIVLFWNFGMRKLYVFH